MIPVIKSRFKPLATHLHGAFSFPHISSFSQLGLNLSHLRLENTGESVCAAFFAADLILWYNMKPLRGRGECRCRRDKTDFPRREAKISSPTPADLGRVT